MADTSFISYDPNTGLIVKTKSEIMDALIEICTQAYGGSYVVDEGTEMYNLLDIIASSITDAGNACQLVYDAFSFITAQGAPLDALVSLAGVTRIEGETDTQLRARYYKFLYSQSSGTMEGLTARILELTTNATGVEANFVQDVRVYENYTGSEINGNTEGIAWSPNGAYTIPGHSILVVIKLREDYANTHYELTGSGTSQQQNIDIAEDVDNINNTILDYKSLGCGVVQNNMRNEQNDLPYYFAISINSELKVKINIWFTTDDNYTNYHAAVENHIKNAVVEYLNGLELGEDIQFSGIMSCVYKAYEQLSVNDYIFYVGSSASTSSVTNTTDDIVITGTGINSYSSSGTSVSINLNQVTPKVVVPYTAYIDVSVSDITVNSGSQNNPIID